jgi:membrane protease YdiL (CAAX protease family)
VTRGLLEGALAIAVPSLCLVATGALRVVPGADTGWGGLIAVSVSVLAPAALWEELLFRGYAFAVLRDVWGWRIALAVSSIVFGLLHLGNLGWTVEAIAMVMLAGVMLGGVVLVTNSLYAAWAAHLGWNLVLALGLHASVSGYGEPAPAYRVVDAGPAWLTGGGWGPEGGVAAGLGMLAGLWYLTRYARKREHA